MFKSVKFKGKPHLYPIALWSGPVYYTPTS